MALITAQDILPSHPATPAELLAHGAREAAAAGRRLVDDARTLQAYVSAGWWIADCPNCNAGIALHPAWPIAVCLGQGCFCVYQSIAWPKEREAIEGVLEVRPMINRNWLCAAQRRKWQGQGLIDLPDETVAELEAENERKGLPPRERVGRGGR